MNYQFTIDCPNCGKVGQHTPIHVCPPIIEIIDVCKCCKYIKGVKNPAPAQDDSPYCFECEFERLPFYYPGAYWIPEKFKERDLIEQEKLKEKK